MRVVVDSSVWISALLFGGTPLLAIEKVLRNDRIVFCSDILSEIEIVLARKFASSAYAIHITLAGFLQNALKVEPPGLLTGMCRDPKDDIILECAVIA